ncbi:MAG: hypothetical protein WCO77_10025 [bacterium]
MTTPSSIAHHQFLVWGAAVICGGLLGGLLAWFLVSPVDWLAASAGWLLATLNSLVGRLINRRAIGAGLFSVVGWGLAANAFRLLTLSFICAFIAISMRDIASSFFTPLFVVLFILMAIDVRGLFSAQYGCGNTVGQSNGNECCTGSDCRPGEK